MDERDYVAGHPWLTFAYRIEFDANAQLWARLGEAFSKCQHLTGAPLTPAVAQELGAVYLAKGALATTAIEGNTLSEEEVGKIISGGLVLPPSQRYLQQEVENVVAALRAIDVDSRHGGTVITVDWIKQQNRHVLAELDTDEHVAPGEFTTANLVVGNYRGAPPQDVPYLMDRLVAWIAELTDGTDSHPASVRFFGAFLAATLSHLYLAWIHPFGDGNGRTARLLECAILTNSGLVPWLSANLLSDHYNRTRSEYYRRLANASSHGDVTGFICYAAQGFVDLLREQIELVQRQQLRVSWVNFVHQRFQTLPNTEATARQRTLLLSLPDGPTPLGTVRRLTPELAEQYAGRSDKTVTRDVNRLQSLGLVVLDRHTIEPAIMQMAAFIPGRASSSPRDRR
ncbi:Fic family protein [Kutzneria sp. 744]|uniref:Fic family protein n=1 Tax=Kutzneria sp. (strain 744) TaxID=345341 RepID=UPI0003EEE0CF|nr:Fic family protein [Kutzneria sp. 744]EWM16677.1 fic family protein [Kutzneria sp. 744]